MSVILPPFRAILPKEAHAFQHIAGQAGASIRVSARQPESHHRYSHKPTRQNLNGVTPQLENSKNINASWDTLLDTPSITMSPHIRQCVRDLLTERSHLWNRKQRELWSFVYQKYTKTKRLSNSYIRPDVFDIFVSAHQFSCLLIRIYIVYILLSVKGYALSNSKYENVLCPCTIPQTGEKCAI